MPARNIRLSVKPSSAKWAEEGCVVEADDSRGVESAIITHVVRLKPNAKTDQKRIS